jgi:hypothetical protein
MWFSKYARTIGNKTARVIHNGVITMQGVSVLIKVNNCVAGVPILIVLDIGTEMVL